ncbi:MAG: diaminopimelate decarboxylase [Kiritimatiellae bacterium]|nr:diaminopimelate decarboxylase [Kiritimatiellia bacterium]
MSTKTFPLTASQLEELAQQVPTPFYVYDEVSIRNTIRRLKSAFSWNQGFHEYFAVKATPNPFILKVAQSEGCGMDCSSLPELLLCEKIGVTGEDIMFTSNDTPAEEFRKAKELGANINLDDISHIDFLEKTCGLPDLICFRWNPGPLKGGNSIIGKPEEAKYGFTTEQLFEGYRILRDKGIKRFGIHTMVASNELNPQYFIDTAVLLFDLMREISSKLGITFEFANIGGGVGIPYRLDQEPVDLARVGEGIHAVYDEQIAKGLAPFRLYMECGRVITGPYGWLISRVRHIKQTYRTYVGLDACMANLMRPALYGAYHHISVPAKAGEPDTMVCDVTGSLCENNDKFAIQRSLPTLVPGDLVVIHDAGAHGHAMGFQYNGKLRCAELLLREGGSLLPIRRAETVDDYFATLDFDAVKNFRA